VILAVAAMLLVALILTLVRVQSRAKAEHLQDESLEAQLRPLRNIEQQQRAISRRIDQTNVAIAELQGALDKKTTWVRFLSDLQTRLVAIEDVWLDSLSVARDSRRDISARAPSEESSEQRLVLAGRLLDVHHPTARVSPEAYDRVKRLIASLRESEFVSAVVDEQFDNSQPGLLRFSFTLVVDPQREL
jgi:type IV pilus assembly protein PilM